MEMQKLIDTPPFDISDNLKGVLFFSERKSERN